MRKPSKHWLFMIAKYIFTKYVVIRHINRVNLPKYENTVITAVKKVAGSH